MRKSIFLVLILLCIQLAAAAQYWQQQVNYLIDVTLNDKDNSLDAFEKIEYTNNSADTLHFIWFHIWPNAYKNDRTAFSDQLLINNNTKFYFSSKEQCGYINQLDFKVNNVTAKVEDHPQYIDVIKILLPEPLLPHHTINISTPFHVQLPYNFSRGGHDGETYQVSQWYPKPAVYDKNGWHPMPYLDQGEFYSEYGNFDVRITVPQNYVVAATGNLQNAEEKEWLLARNNFTWTPATKKIKQKSGSVKTVTEKFPPSAAATKTLRYLQNNIHDFAWFADKRFIVNHDTLQLASGKTIDVFTYYTENEKAVWRKSVRYAKDAVSFYSEKVGEYPYDVVSVVQGPQSFGGGMEYPTITVISPTASPADLDNTIAHEIGHNWFYGILGTNERLHPWMDEGINSYYETAYTKTKNPLYKQSLQQRLLEATIQEKIDQPIETSSEDFSEANYDLIAYYKTSKWMEWLKDYLGEETFTKAMHEYFNRWQFKHPQPEDLKTVFENVSGKNLDSAFEKLKVKGDVTKIYRAGTTINDFSPGEIRGKTNIVILPAFGINAYDKFMVGAVVSNYDLPMPKFNFLAVPLFATGSKKINGLGKLNYSFYPDGIFRKINVFVNGSHFTQNLYEDTAGKKTFLSFTKIVPGIQLILKEKDARSSRFRSIQFKSFLIAEDDLRFKRDTVVNGPDTSISINATKQRENRTLNQLTLTTENNRALYPYKAALKIEQGKDFVRAGFTGNYFFNYAKHGGLDVRFFAGKFFYTGEKTTRKEFETDRYHLNMTGANGYEDYTYSDYFIGRNKFEGAASQQIMNRDGFFKSRTDLLAAKVGKTDDWLMAANFSSTIPNAINPLSLLPVKIPLKVFVDIGTYADAWKQNFEGDRFLYDAGLQLSLLKNSVNIYLPLLYSGVYKDYNESILEKKGRMWKKISFNIDVSNFTLRKINRNLVF